jgi:hypothetical protein
MLALPRSSAGALRGALLAAPLSAAACSFALDFDALDRVPPREDEAPDAAAGRDYPSVVIADAPRAYWRFDEVAGPRAADAIGGADGTYLATPVLGVPGALAGSPSTAWRTDGPQGGMNAGRRFTFAGTSRFTLEIWFHPSVVDDAFRHVFQRKAVDAAGRQEVGVFVREDRIVFQRYVDDVRIGASGPLPPLGAWHHLAAAYDGERLDLYVDGAAIATTADARPFSGAAGDLLIGTSEAAAIPFLGTLDEAAVYDVALSGDQIRRHIEAAGRPR